MKRARSATASLALLAAAGGGCILLESYDAPVPDPVVGGGGQGGAVSSSSSSSSSASSSTSSSSSSTSSSSSSSTSASSSSSGGTCPAGSTAPCYTGPAGTMGTGPCKGGTTTCSSDGSAWGPCVGEVVPALEDCTTPEDEDCNGATPACTGTTLWAKRFGGTLDEAVGDVATSAANDVCLVGAFQIAVDFGGGSLTSAGLNDAFVVKYDAAGNHLWSKRYGDAQDQGAGTVGFDTAGDVYMAGGFSGTIDFGPPSAALTSAGQTDVFLAKLDPAGNTVWARGFGDASSQRLVGRALSVEPGGAVVITGALQGTMDFGGSTAPLVGAGGDDVFLAKLDASGNALWAHSFGDGAAQVVRAVALGPAGRVAIVGTFQGTIDFGGGSLVSAGGQDTFVAVFDAAGTHLWSKGFGDAAHDQAGRTVAFDAAGNVWLAGSFMGTVDFGGGPLTAAGAMENAFLAELSPAGAHVQSKRYGDGASPGQIVRRLVIDAAGDVVLGGEFGGVLDFGGGAITAVGTDAFIAKLSPTLAFTFAKRYGDASLQSLTALAVDSGKDILAGGPFRSTIDFGLGTMASAGNNDGFLVKIAP